MSSLGTVLVVGGAGYIGSHTAVALAKKGYQPILLDNFSNSHAQVSTGLQKLLGAAPCLYTVDACDPQAVGEVLRKHAPLYGLIHFAALKSVSQSLAQPLSYYRNNLASLWTLLHEKPPKVVFSSSCTVYGEPERLPIDEHSALGVPASPYGYTKQIGEQMLLDCCRSSEMRGVSLRYFNPIGAHASACIGELPLGPPENLVPALTRAVHSGDCLEIYGDDYGTPDGSCVRDYIHVMDLAEAHVSALQWLDKQPAGCYETFNCGTGRGYSVLEVVATFEQLCQVQVKKTIMPRRAGDIPEIYANVDKANTILKWQCTRSIGTSLQDAWRWQKSLPK